MNKKNYINLAKKAAATQINELKKETEYYKNEIEKDKKELSKIQSDSGLEKYAREKLFMKRENEDIFIIEFDSSNVKK